MRAPGLFLSIAISAAWPAATSSARATFPGTNARIASPATPPVTLTSSLWTPMARESCTSPAIHTMTLAEYENASRARRLGYRAYRNPLLMLFVGPSLVIVCERRFPRCGMTRKMLFSWW